MEGGFSKKLKIELSYNPAIPLLAIYLKEMKMLFEMIYAYPDVAKRWKQPKGPPADEWIKKMWSICTVKHCSATKRMEFCHLKQYQWT